MSATYQPRRGDAVEGWIRRERDEFLEGGDTWAAMDLLLEDYRDHADRGVPLDRDLQQEATQ